MVVLVVVDCFGLCLVVLDCVWLLWFFNVVFGCLSLLHLVGCFNVVFGCSRTFQVVFGWHLLRMFSVVQVVHFGCSSDCLACSKSFHALGCFTLYRLLSW